MSWPITRELGAELYDRAHRSTNMPIDSNMGEGVFHAFQPNRTRKRSN